MRTEQRWVIAMGVCALAACGGSGKGGSENSVVSTPSASVIVDKAASAEEVAKEARKNVSCPAKDDSPARAANAPVDDVLGVRPGMSFEVAATAVACTNDLMVITAASGRGFNIQTYGQKIRQGFEARFAEPRVVKSSKQIMEEMQDNAISHGSNTVREDLQPGQAKWFVGTIGLPNQEQVLSVAREEHFPAGKNPPIATVKDALIKKYGTPTRVDDNGGQLLQIDWQYDPLGRLITEGSPLYRRCYGSPDPDGALNLSPDCGVAVAAVLIPVRGNPDLAEKMQVGVVNHADGTKMLAATEQGLQKADQQRRAGEVEKAAKDTKAPTL